MKRWRLAVLAVIALPFVPLAAREKPYFFLEDGVFSNQIEEFDLKVYVATNVEVEPLFVLGIGWDPTVVDLQGVNYSGTIFEDSRPSFWQDVTTINIKPDGKPVLGFYGGYGVCDPCLPKIPSGERVPILNLQFLHIGPHDIDTSTSILFVQPPGPKAHPDLVPPGNMIYDPLTGSSKVVDTRGCVVAFLANVQFIRGDVNGDTAVDVSDPINALNFLFLGSSAPSCFAAANANSDDTVDISDVIYTLNFLYNGGLSIKAPYPACDVAPEDEALDCVRYPPCN